MWATLAVHASHADQIYASLQNLERVENIKVELLICCGDFQAVRNQDDLRNLCAPEKYLCALRAGMAAALANRRVAGT